MSKKHQIIISAKATRSKANRSWRRKSKQLDNEYIRNAGKKLKYLGRVEFPIKISPSSLNKDRVVYTTSSKWKGDIIMRKENQEILVSLFESINKALKLLQSPDLLEEHLFVEGNMLAESPDTLKMLEEVIENYGVGYELLEAAKYSLINFLPESYSDYI